MSNGARVLVGMSGGVDSSLAAALLLEQGYEVVGGFIKNWSDSKDLWTGECAWRGERRDAFRVAARLGISLLTFDFEVSYRERVLGRMFQEYERGLTPNPDVLCNEEIKFGLFFEAARKAGFDYVATGHYAQVERDAQGIAHLIKGADAEKDQSYFLYRLSQEVLQHTLFPVGHLKKIDVRKEAALRAIPTAAKPDSQGICFVGKLNFHEFLRKKIPARPGPILTTDGKELGQHDGLDAYTIGQRQGLQVSTGGTPWYVAAKDREKNALIIVADHDHPLLRTQSASIGDLHWTREIGHDASNPAWELEVSIRYRQTPERAHARLSADKTTLHLEFLSPVWALAPGQSAVFYQGVECLGGGVILEGPTT
ncbi:tRNA 2-thiouridine(34) synthase MnmA [Patescibacteria group bacterium]|nr:tRNA 2-thiouridine(34) synthase MnmA [Patescibacteria group bacterium]